MNLVCVFPEMSTPHHDERQLLGDGAPQGPQDRSSKQIQGGQGAGPQELSRRGRAGGVALPPSESLASLLTTPPTSPFSRRRGDPSPILSCPRDRGSPCSKGTRKIGRSISVERLHRVNFRNGTTPRFYSLECELCQGRDFRFVCLLIRPKCLEQCLF